MNINEREYSNKCPFLMGVNCQGIGCALFNGEECSLTAQATALEQLSTDIGSIQESLSSIAAALNRIADKEG